MSIPVPEEKPLSESMLQGEPTFFGPEVSEVEIKTGEVAAKGLEQGVLPTFSPLSVRKAVLLDCGWLEGVSSQEIRSKVDSILKEKGISSRPAIGAEAVAAQRIFKNLNRLLRAGGHEASLPLFEEHPIGDQDFPKVKVIITEKGATVVGIEHNQLLAVMSKLKTSDPSLHKQVTKFQQEDRLEVVSKDKAEEMKQLADDRFSQVSAELNLSVRETKSEKAQKTEESEEEEPILSPGVTHPMEVPTIEAAVTNDLAKQILFRAGESNVRQSERARQDRREQARREQEDIHQDALKRSRQRQEILQEDIKHDEEKRSVEKRSISRGRDKKEAAARERGEQQAYIRIGKYEERKKAGEPTPSPGSQKSEG